MPTNRQQVLESNRRIRQGSEPLPRRLPDGYVALRIPDEDWPVLKVLFPDLESKDHEIRLRAWKKFEASPIAEPYRVQKRSPAQVKRSANHRIIVK